MQDNANNNLNKLREAGPYLGLGTQLAITMVVMFFLGYWIDGKWETLPLFTIIFSFLGAFGGIYSFIKSVILLNEKKKKDINS